MKWWGLGERHGDDEHEHQDTLARERRLDPARLQMGSVAGPSEARGTANALHWVMRKIPRPDMMDIGRTRHEQRPHPYFGLTSSLRQYGSGPVLDGGVHLASNAVIHAALPALSFTRGRRGIFRRAATRLCLTPRRASER